MPFLLFPHLPKPCLTFLHLPMPFLASKHLPTPFLTFKHLPMPFLTSLYLPTSFLTSIHLLNPSMFGRFISRRKLACRVFLCHTYVDKSCVGVYIKRPHCILLMHERELLMKLQGSLRVREILSRRGSTTTKNLVCDYGFIYAR